MLGSITDTSLGKTMARHVLQIRNPVGDVELLVHFITHLRECVQQTAGFQHAEAGAISVLAFLQIIIDVFCAGDT